MAKWHDGVQSAVIGTRDSDSLKINSIFKEENMSHLIATKFRHFQRLLEMPSLENCGCVF